jgi:3-oxoacyl-[acyl-carrier protein] reductase
VFESLKNKIALVTGATRGIGKAIAEDLARQGVIVVGTGTNQTNADAIASNLQAIGSQVGNDKNYGLVLNTSDPTSIDQAIRQINDQLGNPDILINNAGMNKDNLFLRMTDDEWSSVIETNLSGIFRLTKACIKSMLKSRWGRIINVSSIVAFSGNPGQVNYTAAKAGMIGFSKSLAQEVASRGVTVNTLAPGFIDTDMTKSLNENIKSQLLAKIPVGRLGTAEEVAKAVMFLISDHASYITGNTIHVNGGMLMN